MHRHRKRKKYNYSPRKKTQVDTYNSSENIGDSDIRFPPSDMLRNMKEYNDFDHNARKKALLNLLLMDKTGLNPGIHNSMQLFGFGSNYKQKHSFCLDSNENVKISGEYGSSSTISDDDLRQSNLPSSTERGKSQESVTESEVVELYRHSNSSEFRSLHSSLDTEDEFRNHPKKDMEVCLSEVLVHLLGSSSHISRIVKNRVKCQHDQRFRKPRRQDNNNIENTVQLEIQSHSSSSLSYRTTISEIPLSKPKHENFRAEFKYLVGRVNDLEWKVKILFSILLTCMLLMLLSVILNINCKEINRHIQ